MNNILLIFSFILIGILVSSCGGDDLLIPKPPTYMRSNFPEHKYKVVEDNCPYRFELNEVFSFRPVIENGSASCHKDIQLGPLNGVMHFSYINMEDEVNAYINYALNKVDEHKIKATGISDEQIIRKDDRVFGTFFELKGDVASPFQFYLTDSIDRFVSGVVYFNTRPNYDSLRPSLEYLKQDLKHLLETFKWK